MNDKIFKAIDSATKQGYAVRFDRDEVQPENIMITLVKDNYYRMYTLSTLMDYKCVDLFWVTFLSLCLKKRAMTGMRLLIKWNWLDS